jgi:hypothetical protein
MNEVMAKNILGFKNDEIITHELCKKRYKMLALKYHPDKNFSSCGRDSSYRDSSCEKFIQISEAYQYLSARHCDNNEKDSLDTDYKSLFISFMKNILGDNIQTNETLFQIFIKITSLCNTISNEDIKPLLKKILINIEKDILIKIHGIITKYNDVFHITQLLLDALNETIQEKNENESCIFLYPWIDDLLDEKLYKLCENNQNYIVPLWHHELIYDENIRVKCIPLLSENIHIDNFNNILVSLHFTIENIFTIKQITFDIGERVFSFDRENLKIKKFQVYRLKGQGIPKINNSDILDVSKRGDILVSIFITE